MTFCDFFINTRKKLVVHVAITIKKVVVVMVDKRTVKIIYQSVFHCLKLHLFRLYCPRTLNHCHLFPHPVASAWRVSSRNRMNQLVLFTKKISNWIVKALHTLPLITFFWAAMWTIIFLISWFISSFLGGLLYIIKESVI